METKQRDPLGPIEFVVTLLGALVIASLVLAVPLTVFGSGSMFGIGDSSVCGTVAGMSVGLDNGELRDLRTTHGADWTADDPRVCAGHAPAAAQWLDSGAILVSFLLFAGFLLLTWRAIRAARAHGLFAPVVAHRITVLGWYLLVGSLVAMVLSAACRYGIVRMLVVDPAVSWANYVHVPGVVLIAGLGVISLGRVMAHAVAMQREVDTLV